MLLTEHLAGQAGPDVDGALETVRCVQHRTAHDAWRAVCVAAPFVDDLDALAEGGAELGQRADHLVRDDPRRPPAPEARIGGAGTEHRHPSQRRGVEG